MILIKLAAIYFFCYMMARGMAREDNIARLEAEKVVEDVQKYAGELGRLHESEKQMLMKTIQELREELEKEKVRNEGLLEFRRTN